VDARRIQRGMSIGENAASMPVCGQTRALGKTLVLISGGQSRQRHAKSGRLCKHAPHLPGRDSVCGPADPGHQTDVFFPAIATWLPRAIGW